MKYEAVLFDLDGTLLDTLEDLVDSVNEYLAGAGYPQRPHDEVRSMMGYGARELIRRALPGPVPDDVLDKAVADYKAIYKKNMSRTTGPYPGIPEVLQHLHDAGIKVAVLSNKPDEPVRALCAKEFGPLVTFAMGDRPDHKRKPDPQPVNYVIEQLGVPRDKVLYVGDSEVDVQTAKNAGIPSGAVTWGFRDRPELAALCPDYLLDTPEELAAILGLLPDDASHGKESEMDSYYIMGVRVNHRQANAGRLQECLTKHGCNIRLRVGFHETSDGDCSDDGLIMLQVCGDAPTVKAMLEELDGLDGVHAKLLDLN